jgi:hypothetical protein
VRAALVFQLPAVAIQVRHRLSEAVVLRINLNGNTRDQFRGLRPACRDTLPWTRVWLVAISLTAGMVCLPAQTALTGEDLEALRAAKALELHPQETPRLERSITKIQNSFVYRALTNQLQGIGFGFGQMVPGSGFSIGPQYVRNDLLDGRLNMQLSARVSTREYYATDLKLSWNDLLNGRMSVDFDTAHRNFGQMPYYGPGPDSRKTGRSDFRYEDTYAEIRPIVHPFRRASAGLIGGITAINVGPGTSDTFISTEQQFSPELAHGIDRQTGFWRGGGFVVYDWRDRPSESTRGGKYGAEYVRYQDRSLGQYSFYRLNLEAQQYWSFFHSKRTFAARVMSSLTDTNSSQRVPFYLQPTLGGPDSLRGYRPYRFFGDNSVLLNGEYRWEVSPSLDMAVFADAGKVFDRWNQWNFHRLESDVGIGFRAKTRSATVFRFDVGFSHEGCQVSWRMNDILVSRPQ